MPYWCPKKTVAVEEEEEKELNFFIWRQLKIRRFGRRYVILK